MKQPRNELSRMITNVPQDFEPADMMNGMDSSEKFRMGLQLDRFARRTKRDPALWALVQAKKAQLQAEGYFDRDREETSQASAV